MTEFSEKVERQRILLEAEEWANGVNGIHVHGLNSMWYDDRPQDTEDGKMVTDTSYNNGLIKREQDGEVIAFFGEKLEGDDLIREYQRKVMPTDSQVLMQSHK